jgi:hypothetical protein
MIIVASNTNLTVSSIEISYANLMKAISGEASVVAMTIGDATITGHKYKLPKQKRRIDVLTLANRDFHKLSSGRSTTACLVRVGNHIPQAHCRRDPR